MNITKRKLAKLIKEAIESEMGQAVPPEELRDALWSHISDMFKEINGFRPRGMYDWQNMPIEELENLHHKLSAELDEQEDDAWDGEEDWYEYRHRADQDMWHKEKEQEAAEQAVKDEEERMLTPEEGEAEPQRMGMRRRRRRIKRMEETKKERVLRVIEQVIDTMIKEEEEKANIQQKGQVKSDVAAAGKAEDKNKVAAQKQQKVNTRAEIEQMLVQYIQKLAGNVDAKELKLAVKNVNAIVQKA